jgi:hypothetical protein
LKLSRLFPIAAFAANLQREFFFKLKWPSNTARSDRRPLSKPSPIDRAVIPCDMGYSNFASRNIRGKTFAVSATHDGMRIKPKAAPVGDRSGSGDSLTAAARPHY